MRPTFWLIDIDICEVLTGVVEGSKGAEGVVTVFGEWVKCSERSVVKEREEKRSQWEERSQRMQCTWQWEW